ncbi:hypothetical protein ACIBF6_41305 [Streptosporangium amethystogenes]|uniref:hypothetical protein n=1 Tax=Streptosporangium amethystogenes TaxID=2002 RepID=UPI00378F401B
MGSFEDLTSPEGLHCDPPGKLADYRRAARALIKFDEETAESWEKWKSNTVPVGLYSNYDDLEIARQFKELDALIKQISLRRERLMENVSQGFHEDRLMQMILAWWIADGRKPRAHDPRFEKFLNVADAEFESVGITAVRSPLSEATHRWLYRISQEGLTAEAATAQQIEFTREHLMAFGRDRSEEFAEKAISAWRNIGRTWTDMLHGTTLTVSGNALVLYGYRDLNQGFDLTDIVESWFPSARIRAGHLHWQVGLIPVAATLGLKEMRELRRGGIVITEKAYDFRDADKCKLLLCNLMRISGLAHLAQHVLTSKEEGLRSLLTMHDSGDGPYVEWEAIPRFGDELREQCRVAMEAARRGKELPPPSRKKGR